MLVIVTNEHTCTSIIESCDIRAHLRQSLINKVQPYTSCDVRGRRIISSTNSQTYDRSKQFLHGIIIERHLFPVAIVSVGDVDPPTLAEQTADKQRQANYKRSRVKLQQMHGFTVYFFTTTT